MLANKKDEAKFFFSNETTGERFDLFAEHVVGRNQGDFQFPQDPRMSGKHGKFTVEDGGVRVEDLASRNGILVNGKKIAPGTPVRVLPGDMIEMGNHTFCIGRGGNVPIGSISKIREETATQVLPKNPPKSEPVKAQGPAQIVNIEDFTAQAPPKKTEKIRAKPATREVPAETPMQEDMRLEQDLEQPPAPQAQAAALVMLAALGAIFLAMTAAGADPINPMFMDVVRWGANYGPETTNGEWWRLGASAFIHAGLAQLVASSFAFWQISLPLGASIGTLGIFSVFFGAQFVGAVMFVATQPDQAGFGALYGLVGLFGALATAFFRDRSILDPKARPVLWASAAILFASNLGTGLRDVADLPCVALAFATGAAMSFIAAPKHGLHSVQSVVRFARPAAAAMAAFAAAYFIFGTIEPVSDQSKTVRAIVERFLPIAERYDRIRANSKTGQASALEMTTAINNEFLPVVRELKLALENLPKFDDDRQTAVESLKSSISAWERAWTLQAQGLAANDSYLLKEALEFEAAGFSYLETSARTLEQWKMRPAR